MALNLLLSQYFLEFLKDLYWVRYYSSSILMICLPVLQMFAQRSTSLPTMFSCTTLFLKRQTMRPYKTAISLIESWSISNFLAFNTSKCKCMVISRKPTPKLPHNQLQLLGMPLQMVDSYKYLGLLLSSNMSWSPHIESICSKARQILGLLYRRFYDSTDPSMIKQLYLSMVRAYSLRCNGLGESHNTLCKPLCIVCRLVCM